MRQPELLVNFFDVVLPDKPLLLSVRDLSAEENLRAGEYFNQITTKGDTSNTKLAILTVPSGNSIEYRQDRFAAGDIKTYLMGKLLENGLKVQLKKSGKEIEGSHLSFVAFDPNDVINNSVPSFLTMRRGVELTFDSVVSHRKRNFGFFASVKVRQHFNNGLTDKVLASIAIGQEVFVQKADQDKRATLLEVNGKSKLARVQDSKEQEEMVPFDSIRVPASRPLLVSYGEAIQDKTLANRILMRSQKSSFRINENSIKNRLWLRNEVEFVRTWLNGSSAGGRIYFEIPNAGVEAFLSAQPSVARGL